MSQHGKGGRFRSRKPNFKVGEKAGEALKNITDDNPKIRMFKSLSLELDAKHDRYERIVKISRDVTIESKRIIFSLHSLSSIAPDKLESSLKDIDVRLKVISNTHLLAIALELQDVDPYQFQKAFGGGLEEFVEAIQFYKYIKTGNVVGYDDLKEEYLTFNNNVEVAKNKSDDDKAKEESDESIQEVKNTEIVKITLLFTIVDFILGLADFTGELMRKSVNSITYGQLDECYKTLHLCRDIQIGFMKLTYSGMRNVSRKYQTLRQSIAKMEQVCYTLSVRGNEIPTVSLIDVMSEKAERVDEEDDEGIF